jgi:hypothetical protein
VRKEPDRREICSNGELAAKTSGRSNRRGLVTEEVGKEDDNGPESQLEFFSWLNFCSSMGSKYWRYWISSHMKTLKRISNICNIFFRKTVYCFPLPHEQWPLSEYSDGKRGQWIHWKVHHSCKLSVSNSRTFSMLISSEWIFTMKTVDSKPMSPFNLLSASACNWSVCGRNNSKSSEGSPKIFCTTVSANSS